MAYTVRKRIEQRELLAYESNISRKEHFASLTTAVDTTFLLSTDLSMGHELAVSASTGSWHTA
jgi:hypothetical protein